MQTEGKVIRGVHASTHRRHPIYHTLSCIKSPTPGQISIVCALQNKIWNWKMRKLTCINVNLSYFCWDFQNEADCRCNTHKYTLFALRSRCLRGVNNTTRAPANLAGTWGLWGKRSLVCLRGASPLNTCRLAEADIHTTVQHKLNHYPFRK